ncbi:MAG: 4-hydroxybutyrate--acetyl-CoA CoA transferase, partial [Halanaerobiaceae bacterium]
MNQFKKNYNDKLISLEKAAGMVNDGDKVTVAMAGSEPQGLLASLAERANELNDVTLVSCLMMGEYGFHSPDMIGHIKNETWFYGQSDRKNHH